MDVRLFFPVTRQGNQGAIQHAPQMKGKPHMIKLMERYYWAYVLTFVAIGLLALWRVTR